MEALEKVLEREDFEKIDLDKEYEEALKNPIFKEIAKKTKLSKKDLKNYTSLLEEATEEYSHCLECKNIL